MKIENDLLPFYAEKVYGFIHIKNEYEIGGKSGCKNYQKKQSRLYESVFHQRRTR